MLMRYDWHTYMNNFMVTHTHVLKLINNRIASRFMSCIIIFQNASCTCNEAIRCAIARDAKKTGQIPMKVVTWFSLSLTISSRWSKFLWETFLNNSIFKLLLWRPQPTITIKKFKIFFFLFLIWPQLSFWSKKKSTMELFKMKKNSSNNPSIDSRRRNSAKSMRSIADGKT